MLRERDGRLLVVATATRSAANENDQLVVVGLSASGTLDGSFGSGGVAAPGVQSSCLQCSPAALAPDGSIVLTGNTGQIPPGIAQHPGVVADFHWVVARLTPTGRLDPRFGAQGIVTLPGASGVGYASVCAARRRRRRSGRRPRRPEARAADACGRRGPLLQPRRGDPALADRASSGSACAVVRTAASTRSAAGPTPLSSCATPPRATSIPTSATGGVVRRVMPLTLGDGPAELLRAPRGGDIVVGPFAPASTLETPGCGPRA